jgi:molybdate transport system substrate-binding protein
MRRILLTAVTVAALTLTACGSDKPATPSSSKGPTGEITVLAAASLTEVFNQLGTEFKAAHPGSDIKFSFGASSTLAQQITQGAPADVFASASAATMKTVTDAGDATGTPTVFVRNQIVIAVAPGNPKGIKSLADLTKPGLKVMQCAKEVPCGAAAQKALDAAGVKLTPVSFEQDVKATLTKVELGEADAALVYRTDVNTAGGKVDGVEFPESAGAITDYPIVVLKNAPNAALAQEWVAFVLQPSSIDELVKVGFQKP